MRSHISYQLSPAQKKCVKVGAAVLLKKVQLHSGKKKPEAYSSEWKVDRLARAVTDIF
jgi:hypothetical protein